METAREDISQPNINMSLHLRIFKEVFNKGVQITSIIEAILIEEPIDNSPAPGLYEICIFESNLLPEFNHFLNGILFLSFIILSKNVGVKSSDTDA